jgi:hypothetical protein
MPKYLEEPYFSREHTVQTKENIPARTSAREPVAVKAKHVMLSGDSLSLHRGSLCYISSPGAKFDGACCTVLSFSEEKARWHVRLQDTGNKDSRRGKTRYVLESMLRLRFCVLQQNALPKRLVEFGEEREQGGCGRGLVTVRAIRAGQPLFEERPLVVVTSDLGDPRRHYNERFVSYTTLARAAARCGEGSAEAAALDAFEGLCTEGVVPEAVRRAARAILDENDPAAMSAEEREGSLAAVTDVLMRFEANQFGLDNGADGPGQPVDSHAACRASALYPFTARLNHSCEPSCTVMSKQSFCAEYGGTYRREEHDDVVVAVAKRDLKTGEALTSNYVFGPTGFPPEWSVHQRRQLLLRKGFLCACTQCTTDLLAEKASTKMEVPSAMLGTPTRSDAPHVLEQEVAARRKAIEARVVAAREQQAADIPVADLIAKKDVVADEAQLVVQPSLHEAVPEVEPATAEVEPAVAMEVALGSEAQATRSGAAVLAAAGTMPLIKVAVQQDQLKRIVAVEGVTREADPDAAASPVFPSNNLAADESTNLSNLKAQVAMLMLDNSRLREANALLCQTLCANRIQIPSDAIID